MTQDGAETGAGRAIGVASHRSRRPRPAATAGDRRRLPLRVRDWRVRAKLGAVLVIPAVAFLVVAGLQASLSVRQAAALDDFAGQVAFGEQVTMLVHELQFERDWAGGQLATAAGRPVDARQPAALAEAMAPARVAVAEAQARFEAAAAPLRDRPALRAPIATADAALAELATVRVGMAEGWLGHPAVFDGYTHAIESLQALLPVSAATEQVQVQGLRELAELKELTAQLRGEVHAVLSAGGLRPGDAERLAELRAQRLAALERFRGSASAVQLTRFDEVVRGQAVRATDRLEESVLARQEVAPPQWWSAATTELELLREVEVELLTATLTATGEASRDGWRQTIGVTAAALAIIVASLLLSVGIGRSMVRSLRLLRRQAVDVAQVRLPGLLERLRTLRGWEPVPEPVVVSIASGRDEVAEVSEAFTQVHHSAVRLAVEQAQMRRNASKIYVNLARRSQILVERQLELLDDLERDETNAGQLANLFRLDHLATRMRRNNESLLVLTDSDPVRRHEQPVQLAAVALAAIAEIERYQRVRDRVAGELHVAAHVAADLVHLLAELLDNATAFSPPERTVTLAAGSAGAPAGALVEITDSGMGMPSAALAEANAMLADPPPIDVAASVRMGLVVVAHLAARHGIQVSLASSTGGTTATVLLPQELLATPPAAGQPVASGAAGQRPAGVVAVPSGRASDGRNGSSPAGDRLAGNGPASNGRVGDGLAAAGSAAELPGDAAGTAAAGRRIRRTPVRAEDVLGNAHIARDQESVWWSRPHHRAAAMAAQPPYPGDPRNGDPRDGDPHPDGTAGRFRGVASRATAVPTHRTSASGLPIRVPLAQLPRAGLAATPPAGPRPVAELDPTIVGGTLSSFYGGVHRAESETTTETETETETETKTETGAGAAPTGAAGKVETGDDPPHTTPTPGGP